MNNATMGVALVCAGFRSRLKALTDYGAKSIKYLNATVHVPSFLSETDLRALPVIQVASAF